MLMRKRILINISSVEQVRKQFYDRGIENARVITIDIISIHECSNTNIYALVDQQFDLRCN